MKTIKWILITLLLLNYNVLAQNFDFVLNNGNLSYRNSPLSQIEKVYMGRYMSLYETNIKAHYLRWSNTFVAVGANLPPFGKPPSGSYAGLCLGAGSQVGVDWNDTGYRTHDLEGEGMFDMSFFLTIPTNKLFNTDNMGIVDNTDLTIKFNSIIIEITDARIHFSNFGLTIRKKVLNEFKLLSRFFKFSGASISIGVLYSTSSGREDDILNGFENDIPDSHEPPEITVIDENTNGTITMGVPANPDIPSFVYFPYVEFQHLSFQTVAKGYFNIYNFLDFFIGANLVVAPINEFYGDVYSSVNIRITDNGGLDKNYDGRMTIRGTTKGDLIIPMGIFGLQFNLGPVKIPVQISLSPTTDTRSLNTGLFVAF